MRVISGALVGRERAWPSVVRIQLRAPGLGTVGPGQCVLVGRAGRRDPVPAHPLLPCAEPAPGLLDVWYWEDHQSLDGEVARWRPEDALRVLGPVGRPFQADGRTRRALLVGAGPGIGPLLLLAQSLLAHGVEVTFVSRQQPEGRTMPAALLPPEVEYVLVPEASESEDGALLATVESLLQWADQLFLALPQALLPGILNVLRRRLLRLRKGFAQALVLPTLLPCGVGACDLCTIGTREGSRRLCRDGLTFDLLTLL